MARPRRGEERQLSPLFTWRSAVASKESPLSATQRHVALTLSLHMNERGGSCFPSVATLAEETGLGVSTVRTALRELDLQGWLQREIRGGNVSNLYHATIPLPPQELAGSVADASTNVLPVTPSAAEPLPRQELAVTPSGAEDEDVKEDVKEDVQQQNLRDFSSSTDQVEHEEHDRDQSAAALLGEPPRLSAIAVAVGRFRRADIRSLRVVEPLAVRLTASEFEETVERALERRAARNDVGLLVHLLRIRIDERTAVEQRAVLEAVAASEEARLVGLRRDPEAYVHRLLALPHAAIDPVVDGFLDRYVPDETERARLRELAATTRRANRAPVTAIRHWIRWVSLKLERDTVHTQLDEWLDEWSLSDHVERAMLHDLADDTREPAVVAAADPKLEAA